MLDVTLSVGTDLIERVTSVGDPVGDHPLVPPLDFHIALPDLPASPGLRYRPVDPRFNGRPSAYADIIGTAAGGLINVRSALTTTAELQTTAPYRFTDGYLNPPGGYDQPYLLVCMGMPGSTAGALLCDSAVEGGPTIGTGLFDTTHWGCTTGLVPPSGDPIVDLWPVTTIPVEANQAVLVATLFNGANSFMEVMSVGVDGVLDHTQQAIALTDRVSPDGFREMFVGFLHETTFSAIGVKVGASPGAALDQDMADLRHFAQTWLQPRPV